MKRDLEWKEKLDDGVKRTVRIKFLGQEKVKWQFKRSDEENWDYNSPPTSEDLKVLEEKVGALYQRRRAAFRDLEFVKRMRKENG